MLIGITGKAGSGKDTAFRFIKEWAESEGRPARRDAFADRLKLSVARLFHPEIGMEDALRWCNAIKHDGTVIVWGGHNPDDTTTRIQIDGRTLLQRYGTEAHRDVFGYDFWISAVISQYDPAEIMVVTDVRFDNEAHAIRDKGGEVWHILRTRNVNVEDTHASEQPISADLVDHCIVNDGSLDHLRDLVQSRIERKVYA